MKKQIIISLVGIATIAVLFFFGKTTSENKVTMPEFPKTAKSFNIQEFIENELNKLTPVQKNSFSVLQSSVNSSEQNTDKILKFNALAAFCKDSIHSNDLYIYYTGESAKLDNSEKSLNFAAQLFLEALQDEQNASKLDWKAEEAISLFERAIKINPNNDDLHIGLGSCYVYGKGRNGNPQETMKDIQELLGVVRKDSSNMKAQLMLGIGGFVSGQFDKALIRLNKVVAAEPENLQAIVFLADTYAAKGETVEAIKWYNVSKRIVNDIRYSKEVDERIKQLPKQ